MNRDYLAGIKLAVDYVDTVAKFTQGADSAVKVADDLRQLYERVKRAAEELEKGEVQ